MRQPSFTKTGPGRRPAHVNKLLQSFYTVAQEAIRLAKDSRDSGNTSAGLAWLLIKDRLHTVWHDDHLSYRKGVLRIRPKYGGEVKQFTPTAHARAYPG